MRRFRPDPVITPELYPEVEPLDTWLRAELKKRESNRILQGLQAKRNAAIASNERKALADTLLPNKMIPRHLQYEYMQYKAEQARNEQKWRKHRNLQYKA
jgi:hypothetical protein